MKVCVGDGCLSFFGVLTAIISLVLLATPWYAIRWEFDQGSKEGTIVVVYHWQNAFCSTTGDVAGASCKLSFGTTAWNWQTRGMYNRHLAVDPYNTSNLSHVYNLVGALIGLAFVASWAMTYVLCKRARQPDQGKTWHVLLGNVAAIATVSLTAFSMVYFAAAHAPALKSGMNPGYICPKDHSDICNSFGGSTKITSQQVQRWMPAGWIGALIALFPLAFVAWGTLTCGRSGTSTEGGSAYVAQPTQGATGGYAPPPPPAPYQPAYGQSPYGQSAYA